MAGSTELACSLCGSRSQARSGCGRKERNLPAGTKAAPGGVGHWRAFCPRRPLPAVLRAGEEAQRLAVMKPTIMAGRIGLVNTLLTGSPWQPGARWSVSTSPSWHACALKGNLPPLRRRHRARAGQSRTVSLAATGAEVGRRSSHPTSSPIFT